jgi:hypothetical protein
MTRCGRNTLTESNFFLSLSSKRNEIGGTTYIDNTSLSKMRIKANPKGIDSTIISKMLKI